MAKSSSSPYQGYYCPCLIVCHGLSEYVIFSEIKRLLRIPMEVYCDFKSGLNIESIPKFLNVRFMKSPRSFQKEFGHAPIKFSKNVFEDFRLYFVMDVDQATPQQVRDFTSKAVFKDHWCSACVCPILSRPNLDVIVVKAGYAVDLAHKRDSYEAIMDQMELEDLPEFSSKFKAISATNIADLIDYLFESRNKMRQ
jgi:hypothetical protein